MRLPRLLGCLSVAIVGFGIREPSRSHRFSQMIVGTPPVPEALDKSNKIRIIESGPADHLSPQFSPRWFKTPANGLVF